MTPVKKILNSATGVAAFGERKNRLLAAFIAPALMAAAVFTASPEAQAQNWQSLLNRQNTHADRYSASETLRSMNTNRFAVVFQVREVAIENDSRVNFGGVVGAAAGSQLGKNMNGSIERNLTRSLGAALGGVVGSKIQQRTTRKKGYEIMVLEQRSGRDPQMHTVIQQMDHPVNPGDIVGMAGSGNRVRLIEINPEAQRFLQQQLSGRVPEIETARRQANNPAPSGYRP